MPLPTRPPFRTFASAETPAWILERERQKRAQRQQAIRDEHELADRLIPRPIGGGGGFRSPNFVAP